MTLFCTNCQAYLGDAEVCPACGQARPEPAPLAPRWTVALEATTSGTPLLAGGRIFLLTREGLPAQHTALLALDLATQEVQWRRRLEQMLVNDPVLAREMGSDGTGSEPAYVLYVATRSTDPLGEGLLLALDAATGDERWQWVPGAQAISAPVLVEETLYVAIDDDQLCAVEAGSGEEQWRLPLPMPRSVAAAAISPDEPDRLYLPSRGPHICAVEIAARAVAWHFTSADDARAWFLETPALAGGRLFAASTGGAVLALNAGTGELVWRQVPGKGGKPLSGPATDGERLYVGGSDGVRALSLDDGRELWHFATERRIRAAPVAADDVVYAAGRDHRLYALEASTGDELWRIQTERRLDASPVVSGELVIIADRGGQVIAIERELSAEAYADLGRWEEAAALYAAAGELSEAARIYQERLGQPLQAVELWKAAGNLLQVAAAYEQAEHYNLAEAIYQKLGRISKAGEMAALQDEHGRAAALFEAAGSWRKARDNYAQLGVLRKVAELSEKLGDWAGAAPVWERLGEYPSAAEAFWQAESWAKAAGLYERLERWPRAVESHEKAGNWAQAGAIQQKLHNYAAAAVAFIRAARNLESATPQEKARLIELWNTAERCCWRADDEAEAKECHRRLALLQNLPYIEVQIVPPERMIRGRYDFVEFMLQNRGGGEVRRIVVHHAPGEFQGDLSVSQEFRGLYPGQSMTQRLSLRPLVTGPVPLIVNIDYEDAEGNLHEIPYRTHITVVDAAEPPSPPPEPHRGPSAMVSAFADFELLIDQRERGGYAVEVVRSPAGDAKGTFDPPFTSEELDEVLYRLEAGETSESFLRDVGSRLFSALFQGEIGSRFRSSQGMTAHGKGLRLRLRLGSGELQALPWVLLYDPDWGDFLSLTGRTPVVHYLRVPRPTMAHPVDPPLRMLVVPASPRNMEPLDVQGEVASLQEAVEPLVADGALALEVLSPPTPMALRDHLQDRAYHILHFMGHGGFNGQQGCLVLEDEEGLAHILDGQQLGVLFYNTLVRLAVLNACLTARDAAGASPVGSQSAYLGVAPALVDAGLLAVVGMQFSLSDEGARIFAEDFYRMLARHKPVDEAVDQARVAMMLELQRDCRDWAAPVLFLRSGTGDVFPVR